MRGALYFNPSSGARKLAPEEFRSAVQRANLDFVEVRGEFDAEEDVRKRLRAGERLFVAAGGDGTINHVAQPLVNTSAVLGIVPMGTFNHFARDLRLPLDWQSALPIALAGPTRHIDVARVNERYFLNNISLGLYPELVEHREKLRGRSKFKAISYAAVRALRKFPHVSLLVETPHRAEAIKTHIFMVSVNPYDLHRIGLIAPRVSLQGGRLSVYWLPHIPKFELIKVLAKYVSGTLEEGRFHITHTTQLKLQSSHSQIPVGMDGEVFKMRPPLVITIAPKSLSVRVADTRAVPRGFMTGTEETS